MDERRHRVFLTLRYRDAHAAIEWLEAVFGAVGYLIVPGPDDTVAHAELRIGSSVFFLGSAATDSAERQQPPGSAAAYVLVDDVDATYRQALDSGGTDVRAPEDLPEGRGASVRDPEGNIWSFGVYRPQ